MLSSVLRHRREEGGGYGKRCCSGGKLLSESFSTSVCAAKKKTLFVRGEVMGELFGWWAARGFDPGTARSRENRVPGTMCPQVPRARARRRRRAYTHSVWKAGSTQKVEGGRIIITFHQCMWTRANYATYKAPLLKVSLPSMFW